MCKYLIIIEVALLCKILCLRTFLMLKKGGESNGFLVNLYLNGC
jgi:hypothetical protein